jgi:hypothetical protein
MAIEFRGNQIYYYRKVWARGTCYSEYVGAGYLGALCAQLDEHDRWQLKAERHKLRQAIAEQDEIDNQIDELGQRLDELVTAALLVAGYHRHKRQWRKARALPDSG